MDCLRLVSFRLAFADFDVIGVLSFMPMWLFEHRRFRKTGSVIIEVEDRFGYRVGICNGGVSVGQV